MKRLFSAFSLTAFLALSGCVTTGGGQNLTARVDRHEQQIQTLLSQVGQVEQVLPGQAEMWSQMQTMRQELNIIKGKLDDSQGGGVEMMRDRLDRMEAMLRQMASQLGINADSLNTPGAYPSQSSYTPAQSPYTQDSPPAPSVQQTPEASGAVAQNSPTALYDAGIKAFDQRRYKEAVVSFKDFLAANPSHKLAGNAHFWQGESYFQMKDYARAALAYQEVISKFAGNQKMQSSMLKQGMALYYAEKKAAGRERLQELVKRYPNSPEATRAKQFLAQNK